MLDEARRGDHDHDQAGTRLAREPATGEQRIDPTSRSAFVHSNFGILSR